MIQYCSQYFQLVHGDHLAFGDINLLYKLFVLIVYYDGEKKKIQIRVACKKKFDLQQNIIT